MLIPQNEGYDMQLIGIAIRWKTAFHPEGTLLFQSDVLPFLPSLPPLALSCNAARSISKYLAHVPGGRAELSHLYTRASLRPSSRLDYPISTRVPRMGVLRSSEAICLYAWALPQRGAGRKTYSTLAIIPLILSVESP
jgi:hypothetical protein